MENTNRNSRCAAVALVPWLLAAGCYVDHDAVASNDLVDMDEDSDVDVDTDADNDTDVGTDTDVDTDEDSDECQAEVSGVEVWGTPCHDATDCPENTECIEFSAVGSDGGYCAPRCCDWETDDPEFCTDQGTGNELCIVGNSHDGVVFEQPFYCVITCDSVADCPEGSDCFEVGPDISICYGYAGADTDSTDLCPWSCEAYVEGCTGIGHPEYTDCETAICCEPAPDPDGGSGDCETAGFACEAIGTTPCGGDDIHFELDGCGTLELCCE